MIRTTMSIRHAAGKPRTTHQAHFEVLPERGMKFDVIDADGGPYKYAVEDIRHELYFNASEDAFGAHRIVIEAVRLSTYRGE